MVAYYRKKDRFLIAVDCIIFGFENGELKLLLIKRNFEPAKGKWSLMGGFLSEKETLDNAAKRILDNLTGLSKIYMEQVYGFSQPDRDPGERVISVAYYALIRINEFDNKLIEEHGAKWISVNEIPNLIFDHNKMVENAFKKLQWSTRYKPIGFELLPEKFTIPELQALYEAIQQKNYDRRNFSKKILSMGFIDRLDEKQKGFSKKGAYYYKFNKQKYDELSEQGFDFKL
ncbi:NUDIX hydrolase [Flexithrix dorotheae]|uniref:NUDIX hydrolase n=1 Tax=Flexithrix dorotheae TaxID=70993 RepID=UPI000378FCAE|nr:NUDIX domain-containing protein [Flexithrix dorotheae]